MNEESETLPSDIKPERLPKPLRDYMLLMRDTELRKVNGVYIPPNESLPICIVLAVGPGKFENGVFVETKVKPGDRVLLDLGPAGVGTFRWGDKTYGMAPEATAACVLPPESMIDLVEAGSLPQVTLQ